MDKKYMNKEEITSDQMPIINESNTTEKTIELKENTNSKLKNSFKRFMMRLKERIYFRDVISIKLDSRPLVINTNAQEVKEDKASYHEYYIKYKKITNNY